jgi:hypothetical protein
VKRDHQVHLDIQVLRVNKETREFQDTLVLEVPMDQKDLL